MALFANTPAQIAETVDHAERARLGLTVAQWNARKAEADAAAWDAYRARKVAEAVEAPAAPADDVEIDFLAMLAEID